MRPKKQGMLKWGMKSKAEIKAELIETYSKAVDELLEKNDEIDNFVDLEKAVVELAEQTLPKALGTLQEEQIFFPKVSKLQTKSE